MHRKVPAWFGPGVAGKGPAWAGTSPAAYRCAVRGGGHRRRPCRLDVSGQGEALLFMLFPHLRGLRVAAGGHRGRGGDRASCRAAQARCPLCGAVSSRVHGGYARMVADGAAGGRPVLIVLAGAPVPLPGARLPGATFAEQAGGVSARYRRRSVPLLGMLAGFGLELAGRAAARLAGTWACRPFVHGAAAGHGAAGPGGHRRAGGHRGGSIRGPQPPVRNVASVGQDDRFLTSACRYPRSHTNVGDVGMMSGHGGAACPA